MKKSTKKNARKNNYNGRNIYGQRCIEKYVKLEKETAVNQYLEVLADLDAHVGQNIEYSIDASCFTEEENIQFEKMMTRIIALRASMRGIPFVKEDLSAPRFTA